MLLSSWLKNQLLVAPQRQSSQGSRWLPSSLARTEEGGGRGGVGGSSSPVRFYLSCRPVMSLIMTAYTIFAEDSPTLRVILRPSVEGGPGVDQFRPLSCRGKSGGPCESSDHEGAYAASAAGGAISIESPSRDERVSGICADRNQEWAQTSPDIGRKLHPRTRRASRSGGEAQMQKLSGSPRKGTDQQDGGLVRDESR